MENKKVFQASLSEFDAMMGWIREVLSESLRTNAKEKRFEVAIEEALVNIIYYAYPDAPGMVEISYFVDKDAQKIAFVFKDQGRPFDPLKSVPADCQSTLEERKVGGLGIHFIKTFADQVNYKRTENENVLMLTSVL